ncbi:hypothetical protein P8452_20206 [Trifolium repens]|nr:hypothetical protein P8452_20206 [Trifolium repens]
MQDDVIYDATPISYAYPVVNTNEVHPSTSKKQRRTTKEKEKPTEELSDIWEIKERPRSKNRRVDKEYYHTTQDFTLRSKVSALYYQKHGTLPPNLQSEYSF